MVVNVVERCSYSATNVTISVTVVVVSVGDFSCCGTVVTLCIASVIPSVAWAYPDCLTNVTGLVFTVGVNVVVRRSYSATNVTVSVAVVVVNVISWSSGCATGVTDCVTSVIPYVSASNG